MPLSSDPERRRRQLENLRPGRPPAPPTGNRRNLIHGGTARKATLITAGSWAEAIYSALAEEAPLRDEVTGELPAHDRQAVELLASCLARLDAVGDWLDLHEPLDEKGDPRPALDVERRLVREAADLLDRLGMTPKARAALGLDLAQTRATMAELIADSGGDDG
jgi:hypothetical protein